MDTVEHDWAGLFANGKSPTNGSVRDACVLLRWHPDVAGRIRYNAFAKQIVATDRLPWHPSGLTYPRQIEDTDGTRAAGWLEGVNCSRISIATAKSCIIAVGRDLPFNPLVDWLTGLEWDGTPRIGKWLSYYLGAEPLTPYLEAVGPKFLISAVARALRPGCKADCMLVLEGPQGRLKSSSVRTLFGPDWFSDDLPDFGHQYLALNMQGKWCFELAELASLSRAESNKIKAVLSRQVDRFKAPYDRFPMEHPRQCVFVGTTNPMDGYFKDPTGSRRFWPVACGTIALETLAADREQLWAEAVHCFERGDPWWLDAEQATHAKAEQDTRHETDPWEPTILRRIRTAQHITTSALLEEDLQIKVGDQTRTDEMRVAGILARAGWERRRTMVNGIRRWTWYCPTNEPLLLPGGAEEGQ
jgi:putative DNA primase/helicase